MYTQDEAREIAALLEENGYSPEDAAILVDDGMGPAELRTRLAHEPESLRGFGLRRESESLPPPSRIGRDVVEDAARLDACDPDRPTPVVSRRGFRP